MLEEERQKLARDLRNKIDDAVAQCGQDGVVVLAIWCDILGGRLIDQFGAWACAEPDVLTNPGSVLMVVRDQAGQECWLARPLHSTTWIDDVEARLGLLAPLPVSLSFNAGVQATVLMNRSDWTTIGRRIKIADYSTHPTWPEDALARLRSLRPLAGVSVEELMMWWARWQTVARPAAMFFDACPQDAIEIRSLQHWLAQSAAEPLGVWLGCLATTLRTVIGSPDAPKEEFAATEVQRDYTRCYGVLREAEQFFWNAPDIRWIAELIARVLNRPAEFRAICRLTHTVESILRHELVVRGLLTAGSAPTFRSA